MRLFRPSVRTEAAARALRDSSLASTSRWVRLMRSPEEGPEEGGACRQGKARCLPALPWGPPRAEAAGSPSLPSSVPVYILTTPPSPPPLRLPKHRLLSLLGSPEIAQMGYSPHLFRARILTETSTF